MTTVNPYLNFPGTTEEAFKFYRSVFGGDFTTVLRFKDTPVAARVPDQEKEKIMHIALPIGNGNVLMATDALESMGHTLTMGNNVQLSLSLESKDQTQKLFGGLSAGGNVLQPLQDTFWGAYFGMVKDRFGVQWMLSYDKNQQNP